MREKGVGTLTVLVTDDFDELRSLLRSWIERFGYRVMEAANGSEAVAVAIRERPELILMDLYMPEVDGFVAAARIREHEELKHVPIIGMSAYEESAADTQLRLDPLGVGFNAYLVKPFGPEQLGELLERFLPRSRGASAK